MADSKSRQDKYNEIYEAIREADKAGRPEDVQRLGEYLNELSRADVTTMTPKDLPIGKRLPENYIGLGTAGVAAAGKLGMGAWEMNQRAKARIQAEEFAKKYPQMAFPPASEPTVSGIPVTPGAAQGSGAAKWNQKLGANFAGAQMDEASLAKGKALNQLIGLEGEFAGGSRTPAGIVLPASATPLPGAPSTPAQAPLTWYQNMAKSVSGMPAKVGEYLAPKAMWAANKALPIVGWGGIGYNLADAYNRAQLGDDFVEKAKQAALPLTAAGAGGASLLSKNPRVAIPAASYAIIEPMIQEYLDKIKRGEIKHRAPTPEEYEQSNPMGDMYCKGGLVYLAEGGHATPAWQRKEGKNPEGGLNAKGRASYNRETGGNLKRPQPEGGKRRDSFCARMKGMKKKLTSAETANDPDSRINKSLRAWNC